MASFIEEAEDSTSNAVLLLLVALVPAIVKQNEKAAEIRNLSKINRNIFYHDQSQRRYL